eukprot:6798970-Ditylum_brightwellii.AAC.1
MVSLYNKAKEVREKHDKALVQLPGLVDKSTVVARIFGCTDTIAPEINIKGGVAANITGTMVTQDVTAFVSQHDTCEITILESKIKATTECKNTNCCGDLKTPLQHQRLALQKQPTLIKNPDRPGHFYHHVDVQQNFLANQQLLQTCLTFHHTEAETILQRPLGI